MRPHCQFDGPEKKTCYSFEKIDKTLRIEQLHCPVISFTLTELHKMLRLMGRHFNKLEFYVETGIRTTFDKKLICRYLQEIGKYCNGVEHMEFHVHQFHNDFIPLLQPIFSNLFSLEISMNETEIDPVIDFIRLLPNLQTIILPQELMQHCLKRSWLSLRHFECDFEFADGEENFFAMNPQLLQLTLIGDATKNLKAAVEYLPQIELLSLNCHSVDDCNRLVHLKRFVNNPNVYVNICSVDIKTVDRVRAHLDHTINLKRFSVHIDYDWRDGWMPNIATTENIGVLVSLVKSHPHIEHFGIGSFILKEADVVDIVRLAPNLVSLLINDCRIFATTSLITKLVEVRTCNQDQENPNKLELYIDKSDEIDLDAINENETKRYLSIKENVF